jgi:hypothetical protein
MSTVKTKSKEDEHTTRGSFSLAIEAWEIIPHNELVAGGILLAYKEHLGKSGGQKSDQD